MIPKFKNKDLFERVFVHRSYLNEIPENLESNERLEFLGDSILSFVVSSYIFEKYPEFKEGELTNLRSVLTNTQTLAIVSQKLGLGEQLKLSKGEEGGGGRTNRTLLANTLEALIGGIFIDQGLQEVKEFIEKNIITEIDEIVKTQGLKDPKSALQEKTQEEYKVSPVYKIIKEEGPDHSKVYTVGVFLQTKLLAEGIGKSKQEAEKEAARNAIETLN